LFRGHYQPHVPADLGFYDLRVPEVREQQAALARQYGIEGFCYYEYWFAGKRLLERPFNEVLASGRPDYPFCICWANQTWTGIWHGAPGRILIEQTYPGMDDHEAHFAQWLRAFRDRRYLRVDNRPLLLIYRPLEIPEIRAVTAFWRRLAGESGLEGLHLVGVSHDPDWIPQDCGFDASVTPHTPLHRTFNWAPWNRPVLKLRSLVKKWRNRPTVVNYADVYRDLLVTVPAGVENYPCLVPNWDNTPRSGWRGFVLHDSTPELFRGHVRQALEMTEGTPHEHRLLFVKSWNEWAEGNHLEPDLKFGNRYLEVLGEELCREDRACGPEFTTGTRQALVTD
jgi:lipopolysaccharide biosynthesis protein